MARIDNKALFFTTSPRTPAKMIPEIRLLHELFEGLKWNSTTQEEFIDSLAQSDFFEGTGSPTDKAFSARDRINRAPKALGFVDLKPYIALTEAGRALISGKRPQEIFLRQLLKFQLPSPYHIENRAIEGTFYVRPYLEIMRLVRELEFITFDELKIFAVQLTDYRKFDEVKAAILAFRVEKEAHKGEYKRFVNEVWTDAVMSIYSDNISEGRTRTRETTDASLKKFITTKKSNLRDYADACFRYLRYTGIISIAHRSRTITFFPDKLQEVDYILSTVERKPVFVDDETAYKAHLFSATQPALYVDIKENIVDALMRISEFTRRELINLPIEELKDLRDGILQERKEAVITEQVEKIKSYSLYSEIMDTYNEIISDDIFDAPLMLEYNTWRAMTMLDGGDIKGNFKFDDLGQPLSTAGGNMPDIECDYDDFVLSVEVTMQSGQRQYETEGEPVARHYGQMKSRTGKNAYCLFIAPTINPAALSHFYALNQINIGYYGGKAQIIPLELDQFMRLVDTAYNYQNDQRKRPNPHDVQHFLNSAIEQVANSTNETEWSERIRDCIDQWLAA
jgi:ribosomal protein L23